MKCPKCNGRLFPEQHYDKLRRFDGHRCLNCGMYIDPVIEVNRTLTIPMESLDDGREDRTWRSRFEIDAEALFTEIQGMGNAV